jgi:hypothetical protein
VTPTLAGSRPGGMVSLGEEGYAAGVQSILAARKQVRRRRSVGSASGAAAAAGSGGNCGCCTYVCWYVCVQKLRRVHRVQ